jgi:hypothetical protein
MGRKIVVLLVAAFAAATAFSAIAAPLFFHMEGGICTDGSTTTGLPGGPLLCGHTIKVQIEMVDGYVPGTPFNAGACCETSPVVSFWYSDSVETVNTDFPTGAFGAYNAGLMSNVPGQSYLAIHWFDGFWFDAGAGTWDYAIEHGGGIYLASGTYTDWVIGRVSEPASLALVFFALVTLISVRSRRSHVRIRA